MWYMLSLSLLFLEDQLLPDLVPIENIHLQEDSEEYVCVSNCEPFSPSGKQSSP